MSSFALFSNEYCFTWKYTILQKSNALFQVVFKHRTSCNANEIVLCAKRDVPRSIQVNLKNMFTVIHLQWKLRQGTVWK